ncbi:flagellar basal body-associated FliL family protein [Marinobacter sediminum]|uniref:flagellar basal body-associated FliL family protein n=1 Tax=Marinobacter sediminum TaxID=256323 RepID=UPI00202FEE0F|nr:flagellar basal body-associated FliL family protein [Marinobacter sediminum]MCM0614257.1 flagellar basal body-associated FliL family protein [Marinobacter sediminum]
MTLQPKSILTLIILLCSMLAFPVLAQESDAEEEEVVEETGVTDYIAMEPAFVTHVGTPGNKVTYLKAAISLRTSSAAVRPAVEAHMPRLRHELIMLFGEQTDTDRLTSMEGQQALREEAKKRINQVLEEQQTGEAITGVLFTEFVVQK